MTRVFDRIVVAVPDLQAAVEEYLELGGDITVHDEAL